MNINGISVRFRGDVHLPRCRGKGGGGLIHLVIRRRMAGYRVTWSGERGGGGFDEEAKGGERHGDETAAGKRNSD